MIIIYLKDGIDGNAFPKCMEDVKSLGLRCSKWSMTRWRQKEIKQPIKPTKKEIGGIRRGKIGA